MNDIPWNVSLAQGRLGGILRKSTISFLLPTSIEGVDEINQSINPDGLEEHKNKRISGG